MKFKVAEYGDLTITNNENGEILYKGKAKLNKEVGDDVINIQTKEPSIRLIHVMKDDKDTY